MALLQASVRMRWGPRRTLRLGKEETLRGGLQYRYGCSGGDAGALLWPTGADGGGQRPKEYDGILKLARVEASEPSLKATLVMLRDLSTKVRGRDRSLPDDLMLFKIIHSPQVFNRLSKAVREIVDVPAVVSTPRPRLLTADAPGCLREFVAAYELARFEDFQHCDKLQIHRKVGYVAVYKSWQCILSTWATGDGPEFHKLRAVVRRMGTRAGTRGRKPAGRVHVSYLREYVGIILGLVGKEDYRSYRSHLGACLESGKVLNALCENFGNGILALVSHST